MRRNFFHRYLSAKVLPIWTILLIDVFIIVVSCFLAYGFRYDFQSVFGETSSLAKTILWAIFINLIFFRVFRTYSNVLRFSSFVDIMRIFVALSVSYGILMLVNLALDTMLHIRVGSYSILFIAYAINLAMMWSLRVVVKVFYDLINFDGHHSTNVFIYGAKEVGVNIAKSLRVSLRNHYRLRGFIADEPELIDKVMMGVKVYANDEYVLEKMEERDVHTLIVSPLKMNVLKQSDITDKLLAHNIRLLTAPPLSNWDTNLLRSVQLKEIQIEDLLERETIQVDIRKIASHLEGKRVLITGAAGSIGSEIMRQVVSFNPYKLILVDQAETPLHDIRLELQDRWRAVDAVTIVADVSNATRMRAIFKEFRPQYIFHAAAYKHVPMMEDNVSESIQVNVAGTRILADLAVEYNAEKFVMISTDKAVNPTNVMGCSKRLAEIYVQALAKKLQKTGASTVKFITTRFGNVLGSNGSVIPRFRDQIRNGGPVTVTHPDIIRYFMTIPEACRLVLEAGSMGNGGEIYIFDMGDPVKIVDLAKRMISLSGRTDIKIEFTGLRHGEKLYEELLNAKELTKPTHHDKIMIANVLEYDYDEVKKRIERLIEISYTYNQIEIVAAMKNIVPEFISKNSCFEELDEKKELKEKS
jgi:FlaA1/EpsC-like NDP-sugar epimerase